MSKKVLTGALAAMMAAGMAPTVAGATTVDVDKIYKTAHDATMKALNTKTQADINLARTAIKALPESMEWAIGEFSKQVDTVQHPILKNIVDSIKKLEEVDGLNQTNINAAKASIPAELRPEWKQSYSAAIDKAQMKLQENIVEAVKKAEKSRLQADIKIAKDLIADVAKATSPAIKEWAAIMSGKLDNIVVSSLNVIEVVELNQNLVKVKFEELEENIDGAVISVLDSEKNVVKVEALDLAAGATSATFRFSTPVDASKYTGTWTIEGLKFNIEDFKFVGEFKAANDEFKMEALFDKYPDAQYGQIKNGEHYLAYANADKTRVETIENVKELISTINKGIANKELAIQVIEEAKKGLGSEFTTALGKLGVKFVNDEWLSSYKSKIGELAVKEGEEETLFNQIQASIIKHNQITIEERMKSLDNKEKALEVKLLIEKYLPNTDENIWVDCSKEQLLADVTARVVVLTVTDAAKSNSFTDLDKALESIDGKSNFKYSTVNQYLMVKGVYNGQVDGVVNSALENATSIREISEAIATINKNCLDQSVDKVKSTAIYAADGGTEDRVNFLVALKGFAKVSTTSKTVLKLDEIIDDNYKEYAAAINEKAKTASVATLTADEIVKAVKFVNGNTIGNFFPAPGQNGYIEFSAENIEEIMATLTEAGIENVKDTNKDQYAAEKDLFETALYGSITDDNGNLTDVYAPNQEKVQDVVDAINAKVEALASEDNQVTVDKFAEMAKEAELTISEAYNKLPKDNKLEVVALVKEAITQIEKIEKVIETIDAKTAQYVADLTILNEGDSNAVKVVLETITGETVELQKVNQFIAKGFEINTFAEAKKVLSDLASNNPLAGFNKDTAFDLADLVEIGNVAEQQQLKAVQDVFVEVLGSDYIKANLNEYLKSEAVEIALFGGTVDSTADPIFTGIPNSQSVDNLIKAIQDVNKEVVCEGLLANVVADANDVTSFGELVALLLPETDVTELDMTELMAEANLASLTDKTDLAKAKGNIEAAIVSLTAKEAAITGYATAGHANEGNLTVLIGALDNTIVIDGDNIVTTPDDPTTADVNEEVVVTITNVGSKLIDDLVIEADTTITKAIDNINKAIEACVAELPPAPTL